MPLCPHDEVEKRIEDLIADLNRGADPFFAVFGPDMADAFLTNIELKTNEAFTDPELREHLSKAIARKRSDLAEVKVMSFDAGQMAAVRSYPIGLVGESHYQKAISRCMVGQEVIICRQTDNPFDSEALVVVTWEGKAIGYLPRGSSVHRAIFDERKPGGIPAVIKSIGRGDGDDLGVVIDVTFEVRTDILADWPYHQ